MDVDEDTQPEIDESNLYENVVNSDIPEDTDQPMNSDDEQLQNDNLDVLESGENNLLPEDCEAEDISNVGEAIPCTSALHEANSPICDTDALAMEHEIMQNDDDDEHSNRDYIHSEDIEMKPSNTSMKSEENIVYDTSTDIKQCVTENVKNASYENEVSNISMTSTVEIKSNTVESDSDLVENHGDTNPIEDNIHPCIYDNDENAQPALSTEESMDEIHHIAEVSINFSSHCDTKEDKNKDLFDENLKPDSSNFSLQNDNLYEEANLSISIETSHHSDNLDETQNDQELHYPIEEEDATLYMHNEAVHQHSDNDDNAEMSRNNEGSYEHDSVNAGLCTKDEETTNNEEKQGSNNEDDVTINRNGEEIIQHSNNKEEDTSHSNNDTEVDVEIERKREKTLQLINNVALSKNKEMQQCSGKDDGAELCRNKEESLTHTKNEEDSVSRINSEELHKQSNEEIGTNKDEKNKITNEVEETKEILTVPDSIHDCDIEDKRKVMDVLQINDNCDVDISKNTKDFDVSSLSEDIIMSHSKDVQQNDELSKEINDTLNTERDAKTLRRLDTYANNEVNVKKCVSKNDNDEIDHTISDKNMELTNKEEVIVKSDYIKQDSSAAVSNPCADSDMALAETEESLDNDYSPIENQNNQSEYIIFKDINNPLQKDTNIDDKSSYSNYSVDVQNEDNEINFVDDVNNESTENPKSLIIDTDQTADIICLDIAPEDELKNELERKDSVIDSLNSKDFHQESDDKLSEENKSQEIMEKKDYENSGSNSDPLNELNLEKCLSKSDNDSDNSKDLQVKLFLETIVENNEKIFVDKAIVESVNTEIDQTVYDQRMEQANEELATKSEYIDPEMEQDSSVALCDSHAASDMAIAETENLNKDNSADCLPIENQTNQGEYIIFKDINNPLEDAKIDDNSCSNYSTDVLMEVNNSDVIDDINAENKEKPKALIIDTDETTDKIRLDIASEDKAKNELDKKDFAIESHQEPDDMHSKENKNREAFDIKDNDNSDSNSDGKSDTYVDISKFLISLNNKKENVQDSVPFEDAESIEWNSDIDENMEGRKSGEHSISDCEKSKTKFEKKVEPRSPESASESKSPRSVCSLKADKSDIDKFIESLEGSEIVKKNDNKSTDEKLETVNKDNSKKDIKKITVKSSLSTFKFDDVNLAEEETTIKKEKKPIVAITVDGLEKSSVKKVFDFVEIPGEDIENGAFSRVVIIGENFISSYQNVLSKDCTFKPYFLYKKKISTENLYSKICDHPYLKNSKTILVIFSLGIHDIAKYTTFKSVKCFAHHPKLKIVKEINYHPRSYLKYVSEMVALKKKMEADKSISCVFCYSPLVQFSDILINTCSLSRMQHDNCSCIYFVKDQVKAGFTASRNALLNCNRNMFYKNLNETQESGVFEFLPYDVMFEDGCWTLSDGRNSVENIRLFNTLLNEYVFGRGLMSLQDSIKNNPELILMRNKLKSRYPFRIVVIGDTWLKCVAEESDGSQRVQPLFYCKDGLTLQDISNVILSLGNAKEEMLIIASVPSGEFFNICHFSECKDHSPLQYPEPINDLKDNPLKFADKLSKKIDLFILDIAKNRKNYKVVFLTCYPVYFKSCYTYLLEAHKTSNVSHVSTQTLTEKYNTSALDTCMEKCIKKLNKHIMTVNKENELLSCNIFSLVSQISSPEMFTFPIYIKHKCPPEAVHGKVVELISKYLESLYDLVTDKRYSFLAGFKPGVSTSSASETVTESPNVANDENEGKTIGYKYSEDPKTRKKQTVDREKIDSHKKHSDQRSEKANVQQRYTSNKIEKEGQEVHYPDKYHEDEVACYPEKLHGIKDSCNLSSRYARKDQDHSKLYSDHYDYRFDYKRLGNKLRAEEERRPHRSYQNEQPFYSSERHSRDSYYAERYSRSRSRERRRDRSRSRNKERGRDRSGSRDRRRSRSRDRRRSTSRDRRRSRSRGRETGRRYWNKTSRSRSRSKSKSSRSKQDKFSSRKRSKSLQPEVSNLNDASSTEKAALSNLWEIHSNECRMYRNSPDIHPDHDRVKRMWLNVMNSQGLNIYDPGVLDHWKEYWIKKMENLFQDAWEEKKQKCLIALSSKSKRRSSSRSSSLSSTESYSDSKRSGKRKYRKKSKSKKTKKKKDSSFKSQRKEPDIASHDFGLLSVDQLESRINEFMAKNNEQKIAVPSIQFNQFQSVPPVKLEHHVKPSIQFNVIPPEVEHSALSPIQFNQFQPPSKVGHHKPAKNPAWVKEGEMFVDITTILCQISDTFGALGMSLTVLRDKANECLDKEENPLDYIDDDAKMLLDLIADKIKKILEDSNLSSIKRAIIQEARDRLVPFLELIDSKKGAFGLDIDSLARTTLGMKVTQIIGFIKADLSNRDQKNVSNEDLMSIYLDIKSYQVKLVNQNNSSKSQNLGHSSATSNMGSMFPHTSGNASTTYMEQPGPTRAARVRNEFFSLPLQDKIKKFAQFHYLPFEEKSFLLSHLDELELTDKKLTESLRSMISKSKLK